MEANKEQQNQIVSPEDIEKAEKLKNEANEYFNSKFRKLQHAFILNLM